MIMASVAKQNAGYPMAALLPCLVISPVSPPVLAAARDSDTHIRAVVQSMLREKDEKIEQLEARIRQLEQGRGQSSPPALPVSEAAPAAVAVTGTAARVSADGDSGFDSKLQALDAKIAGLKAGALASGLDIGGFFDINAKTSNSTDQTFSVGLLELDIAYTYNAHFAASSALVLCGNSSGADYASSPAHITCGNYALIGAGKGSAAIGVGFVDFHMFDSSIPPRGRIFNNQGLHIQAGRFDLPFMADYQNYANKDRASITAPITTVRMQKGGFNGDGVRSYGSWDMFNYSVFWTNGVYQSDGTSMGGRLGVNLGRNRFRVHGRNPEGMEFGVSHLTELDANNNVSNAFYGADFSLGYAMLRWQNEFLLQQGHRVLPNRYDGLGAAVGYGKGRQMGYHSTLIADLEDAVHHPLLAFVRYARWQSNQDFMVDGYDGSVVAVHPVSLLSLGLNYKFSEHLRVKFEYTDSLGTATREHYFDKRVAMAQMVVMF